MACDKRAARRSLAIAAAAAAASDHGGNGSSGGGSRSRLRAAATSARLRSAPWPPPLAAHHLGCQTRWHTTTSSGSSAATADADAADAADAVDAPTPLADALVARLAACGDRDADLKRLARRAARQRPDVQRRLVAELTRRLAAGGGAGGDARLEGALLARALWAVSRAGGCPADAKRRLFEEAVPAAYASLAALAPADLARLLTAYAAARCYSQELFAAATEFVWDALRGGGSPGAAAAGGGTASSAAGGGSSSGPSAGGLGALTPGQLSDVAAAYAAADHYDDDGDLWQAAADAAAARARDFSPHQLAGLVEALARLRFRHAPLCGAALAAAASGAAQWPTTALAQVVWALGWLGHGAGPGEAPQLDRVAAAVATRLRNLLTSTDAARVAPAALSRVPGGGVAGAGGAAAAAVAAAGDGSNGSSGNSSSGNAGNGGSEGVGFLGTSLEAAALTAGPYHWHRSGDAAGAAEAGPGSQQQQQQQRLQQHHQRPAGSAAALSWAAGSGAAASASPQALSVALASGSDSDDAAAAIAADADDEDAGVAGTMLPRAPGCVRPALDAPGELREALSRLLWGYAALGRVPAALTREALRLLAGLPPASFSAPQLALLFEAAARAAELGRAAPLGARPELATSARAFSAALKRAPRPLALPPDLQPRAFAAWAHGTRGGSAPLAPPPLLVARKWRAFVPAAALAGGGGDASGSSSSSGSGDSSDSSGGQPPWPSEPRFSSWRYRDPALTSRAGLEAALGAAVAAVGLAPSPPAPELTLDGVLAVPLPLTLRGSGGARARVALEARAPADAARNPPHAPLGAAGVRAAMLRCRGWGVAEVAFSDWADAADGGIGGSGGGDGGDSDGDDGGGGGGGAAPGVTAAQAALLRAVVEGAEADLMLAAERS